MTLDLYDYPGVAQDMIDQSNGDGLVALLGTSGHIVGSRPSSQAEWQPTDAAWGHTEWWRVGHKDSGQLGTSDLDQTDEDGNDPSPNVPRLDSVDAFDPPGRHPTEDDVPETITVQATEDMEYEMSRRSKRLRRQEQEAGNWIALKGEDGSTLRVRGVTLGEFNIHDDLRNSGFTLSHSKSGTSLAHANKREPLLSLAKGLRGLPLDWNFEDAAAFPEASREMARRYCLSQLQTGGV